MGIEEGKYTVFRDIKRRVIDMAVSEVNQHSPIYVSVQYRKEGRQVMALQFLIKRPENVLLDQNTFKETKKTLEVRLKNEYGFSKIQAERSLSTYGDQYILEKIDLIEASPSFQNGKIANLTRYLESALGQDYQPAKSSAIHMTKVNRRKKEQHNLEQEKGEKVEQYRHYQDKEIIKIYDELLEKQKQQVNKEFSDHVKGNIYHDIFLKEGFKNILVADQFCNFVRSKKKNFLEGVKSFDDYCK